MKCERCGCEIDRDSDAARHFNHFYEHECIAALKAKVAEQPKTKPERFAIARKFVSGDLVTYEGLDNDVMDLFTAFEEAKIIISNYIYPEFIDWKKKWG